MLHDRARIYVEAGAGGNGSRLPAPRGARSARWSRRRRRWATAATSSSSATPRAATSRRCGSRPITGQAGAVTARVSSATAPVGRTRWCGCLPGPRSTGWRASGSYLTEPGQRWWSRAADAGGHGNKRFANSTPPDPALRRARASPGESGWIELRLKLLADAGLVGLAERGQVVAARTTDARRAQGRRLPVHDAGAGTGDDRRRRASAGARRHPRSDRRGGGTAPASGTSFSPTSSAAGCWCTWWPSIRSTIARRSPATRPFAMSSPHTGPGSTDFPRSR